MFESMQKCKKGVMWKGSAAHYVLNGLEETLKLEKQLKTGTYKAKLSQRMSSRKSQERLIQNSENACHGIRTHRPDDFGRLL